MHKKKLLLNFIVHKKKLIFLRIFLRIFVLILFWRLSVTSCGITCNVIGCVDCFLAEIVDVVMLRDAADPQVSFAIV